MIFSELLAEERQRLLAVIAAEEKLLARRESAAAGEAEHPADPGVATGGERGQKGGGGGRRGPEVDKVLNFKIRAFGNMCFSGPPDVHAMRVFEKYLCRQSTCSFEPCETRKNEK